MSAVPDPARSPATCPRCAGRSHARGDRQDRPPQAVDQERPRVRRARRRRRARRARRAPRRRWSRSSRFCLAASGTYFLNDANDAEADRLHPTKRSARSPPASSTCAPARIIAVVLIVRRVRDHRADQRLQAHRASSPATSLVTISYTIWLKHEPVIDLAAVAAGLRVPGHRRRRRHRRAAVRLVPHRGRRGIAVHRHREAPRRAGRARVGLVAASPHARRVLHRVPRLRPRGRRRA